MASLLFNMLPTDFHVKILLNQHFFLNLIGCSVAHRIFAAMCGIFTEACGIFTEACGIQFPDQRLDLGSFPWKHRVLITAPPENPNHHLLPLSMPQCHQSTVSLLSFFFKLFKNHSDRIFGFCVHLPHWPEPEERN